MKVELRIDVDSLQYQYVCRPYEHENQAVDVLWVFFRVPYSVFGGGGEVCAWAHLARMPWMSADGQFL